MSGGLVNTILNRRARLRSATLHAHARLDKMIENAGFFDDRPSYVAYLNATLRARGALELALDACQAETLFAPWGQRKLAEALRADIHDLTGGDPDCAPDGQEKAMAYTPAQAIGVLYVLEGSALGARILKQRAKAIGMGPAFGGRHLTHQTAMPKAWGEFLAVLETAPFDDRQEAECIETAIAAFGRFERIFVAVHICKSASIHIE